MPDDLFFYEVGCEPRKGLGALFLPLRRLIRRLLLPIFQRQREILERMDDELQTASRRHTELAARLGQELEALGQRQTALLNRLALRLDEQASARADQARAPIKQDGRQTRALEEAATALRRTLAEHRADTGSTASDGRAIIQRLALIEDRLEEMSGWARPRKAA